MCKQKEMNLLISSVAEVEGIYAAKTTVAALPHELCLPYK